MANGAHLMLEIRRSPIPLYYQISTHLQEQIQSGALKPGTQFTSEKKQAQIYGVSLVTVRAAMRVLLEKGLVVRYAGKGTFVAEPYPVRNTWAIGSLEDLVSTGRQSNMKLLWRRQIYPPLQVAQAFGQSGKKKISAMRTVRYAESEPFMLTDTYHPKEISTQLKDSDFTRRAARTKLVVSIVQEKCGIVVSAARQTMSVEPATQDQARFLDIEPGQQLLAVNREYLADGEHLVQIARAHYRTDHYHYAINLSSVGVAANNSNVYKLESVKVGKQA